MAGNRSRFDQASRSPALQTSLHIPGSHTSVLTSSSGSRVQWQLHPNSSRSRSGVSTHWREIGRQFDCLADMTLSTLFLVFLKFPTSTSNEGVVLSLCYECYLSVFLRFVRFNSLLPLTPLSFLQMRCFWFCQSSHSVACSSFICRFACILHSLGDGFKACSGRSL